MVNKIIIYAISLLASVPVIAEVMTEESEKAYLEQQNKKRLESIKNVPDLLKVYGSTIGCAFHMKPNNVVEVPGKDHQLIALFSIDVGCSGGIAMSRPVFVELELSISNMQFYLNMERSRPSQTADSIPQTVSEIHIQDGKLLYTAFEYDWSKDARCCPSIKNTAELKFENNMWVGIKIDSSNKPTGQPAATRTTQSNVP